MGRPNSIILIDKNYRELSEGYYRYQKALGYVSETCRMRQLYLNEFLSWLEHRGMYDINKVTDIEIKKYHNYLSGRPSKQGGGVLSERSVHSHLKAVEQLFTMLQSKGKVQLNPCSNVGVKYPQQTIRRAILSQPEIKKLYDVCESYQERSLLSLAYGCGLRAIELEQVNIADVKWRDKLLIVPKGKGNKRRVIPMSEGVRDDLEYYIKEEREEYTSGQSYTKGEQALLLNIRGTRMRKYTCNKYLRRIISRTHDEDLINKNISLHNLRHSIATHLIQQGVRVEQVRQFLGHSQLETTQLYTRVSDLQIKELFVSTDKNQ